MKLRKGFTLVELLVVIAIIAILIAMTTAAVQKVRAVGDRARATAEINQLALAMSSFRQEHGSNMMLTGGGPNGEFRLCTSYLDSAGNPLPWPEVAFFRSHWTRYNLSDNGLRVNGAPVPPGNAIPLDANQAMVVWLTGGSYCNFRGLAVNPAQPFLPPGNDDRRVYIELPPGRVFNESGVVDNRFRDPWGTPYAVFSSGSKDYAPGTIYHGGTAGDVIPYATYFKGNLNAGTSQVISAGADRKFGPGGIYTPASGAWGGGQPGADDIGSFRSRILGAPDGD